MQPSKIVYEIQGKYIYEYMSAGQPIYEIRNSQETTRDEIKGVLLEIIKDIDEEAELDLLKPDQPLQDQLDLDSMDFLDIVMELRRRYKFQIPEEDYPELASLDGCVNYLEPKLKNIQ